MFTAALSLILRSFQCVGKLEHIVFMLHIIIFLSIFFLLCVFRFSPLLFSCCLLVYLYKYIFWSFFFFAPLLKLQSIVVISLWNSTVSNIHILLLFLSAERLRTAFVRMSMVEKFPCDLWDFNIFSCYFSFTGIYFDIDRQKKFIGMYWHKEVTVLYTERAINLIKSFTTLAQTHTHTQSQSIQINCE